MNDGMVVLAGRLVGDPELGLTPSGQSLATFELAGLGAPTRCVAWNLGDRPLAEMAVEGLHAGDLVYLEGVLHVLEEAADGRRREAVQVHDLQLVVSGWVAEGDRAGQGDEEERA